MQTEYLGISDICHRVLISQPLIGFNLICYLTYYVGHIMSSSHAINKTGSSFRQYLRVQIARCPDSPAPCVVSSPRGPWAAARRICELNYVISKLTSTKHSEEGYDWITLPIQTSTLYSASTQIQVFLLDRISSDNTFP